MPVLVVTVWSVLLVCHCQFVRMSAGLLPVRLSDGSSLLMAVRIYLVDRFFINFDVF